LSEPLGRSLVPPRPNLGPEPWTTSSPLNPSWLLLAIPISAVVVWALWKLLHRSLARTRADRTTPDELDVTPRGRLVALSMSTKNALAARFGPTWRAKTTEEMAAEPTLAEVLGPEPLKELIEFLDRIDRLKFAVERPNNIRQPLENELADWNPRIAVLISRIEAKSNGRQNKHVAGSVPGSPRQLTPREANPQHVRAIWTDSQPHPPGH
jgi:hypothetical protein